MDAPTEAFLRNSVGMLAHTLKELSAYVGAINALVTKLDNPEIAEAALSLNEGLEELHTSISRVADAFPPPPQNGSRSR